MNKKQFWNDGYNEGVKYRQISDEDISRIVAVVPSTAKTVLDIGCGDGELARQLHAAGFMVTGIDLSDVAIDMARELSSKEITFKQLDIEKSDLDELGTFDIVSMKLVFAFIQNKGEVIEKIKNLLNIGGILVIINPVIVNKSMASEKARRISVDEDITMSIENFGFTFVSRTATPLSNYHELATYVFHRHK
ncbi:class I SAM-dependent methyltransferase [Candidatus Saccharibacteria bacterium]|nr:class I SAM-dependent methyltransferase [Candidatus Saccharibacteria bacterium]